MFLDPFLHLAVRAIPFMVKGLRVASEVGDQEARVATLGGVFRFHDQAPVLVPNAGRILDFTEEALLPLRLAGIRGEFPSDADALMAEIRAAADVTTKP